MDLHFKGCRARMTSASPSRGDLVPVEFEHMADEVAQAMARQCSPRSRAIDAEAMAVGGGTARSIPC